MKRKLYLLVIALVVFLVPEFVLAQENRQVSENFTSGEGRGVSNNLQTRNSSFRQLDTQADFVPADSSQADSLPPIVFYTLERDKEFAHWSAAIGIGGSIYDGDITESAKRIVPTARLDWGFTGVIERSFNPVWGLGLGYAAVPYSAKTDARELDGFVNEWDVYLSVNMLNLFYRSRPQKWGVFVNAGMGITHYNAKSTDRKTGEVALDPTGKPMDLKGGVSWVWPLAALVEYNINKDFAVGLKAEYRLHDKDNMEGQTVNIRQGNWNDAFELFSLTFRYKPHFGKDYHVRNYSYGDPDTKDLEERLAELEEMIAGMDKPDTCCINNAERIKQLEDALAKKPDTVVVKETIKTIDEEGIKRVFSEALRGIQFETAKADIKPISYSILDNVVTIMKENPKYALEIVGHTDNVGSAASNLDLSRRRALSVRDYLIRHGIEEHRLAYEGKGLTAPVATNNTVEGRALNRRVEFIVSEDGRIILKSE